MYGNNPVPKPNSIGRLEQQLNRAQERMQAEDGMPQRPTSLQEDIASELSALHKSIIQQEKPVDVFDELRAAQEVFRKACYDLQRASMKHDVANKAMAELAAKAQATIEAAMMDPTANPTQQGQANGRY